jgi:hypothetical protein
MAFRGLMLPAEPPITTILGIARFPVADTMTLAHIQNNWRGNGLLPESFLSL